MSQPIELTDSFPPLVNVSDTIPWVGVTVCQLVASLIAGLLEDEVAKVPITMYDNTQKSPF